MPLAVSNLKVKGVSQTQGEQEILEFALGERNCSSGVLVTSTNSFAVALIATIILVLFLIPPVQNWFACTIPNISYRILFQAIIFFIIIFIVDRWVESWRQTHPICR